MKQCMGSTGGVCSGLYPFYEIVFGDVCINLPCSILKTQKPANQNVNYILKIVYNNIELILMIQILIQLCILTTFHCGDIPPTIS